ncbi:MAG: hypothetical protein Q8M83_00120, partial [bacterium]|nr:hypothetical protein [bacterium]
KRAQEKGVDVSQIPNFDARFLKLKQEAPKTELNDIIRRTEEFYKSGDIGSAKSWYAEADNKLRLFESKLSKQDVQIFMDRLKAMADLWK